MFHSFLLYPLQLLSRCHSLHHHKLELEIIMASMQCYHSACSLLHESTLQLVTFLSNVFMSVLKDPFLSTANAEWDTLVCGDSEEVAEQDVLKQILGIYSWIVYMELHTYCTYTMYVSYELSPEPVMSKVLGFYHSILPHAQLM